ncbi:hypothetical protein Lalb_Chr01g0023221 [Lupinus albus]|uniref:Uncharacterized protein n=1 Tax=Lupinus albus TaxID=3870 RepID=A0A6A4RC27_LUPAL|nr:hypothetical protein Lalb_Chr01g0023221 [Lupinus albus]
MPFSSQNSSRAFDVNSPPPSVLRVLNCLLDCFSAIALNLFRLSSTSLFALRR